MKIYDVRFLFKVKAEDRFDAAMKVSQFLPENNKDITGYYVIAVKPETSKINCEGCEEFDSYGCVYQFVNNGECKRESLSKPKLSGTYMIEEYKKKQVEKFKNNRREDNYQRMK